MYRVSANVRSVHSLDGAIVLDVEQGKMFQLNPAGARILELLKRGSDEAGLVDQISQEFGVDPEIAEQDVHEFVGALKGQRLLEESILDRKR